MSKQKKKSKKMSEYAEREIKYWRILKTSDVFNWWYLKFFTDLMYDLEILDVEPEEIRKKYQRKFYPWLKKTYKRFYYI